MGRGHIHHQGLRIHLSLEDRDLLVPYHTVSPGELQRAIHLILALQDEGIVADGLRHRLDATPRVRLAVRVAHPHRGPLVLGAHQAGEELPTRGLAQDAQPFACPQVLRADLEPGLSVA